MTDFESLARDAGKLLDDVRRARPLVVSLTNTVAETWTANVLLALGATPAMMHDPGEAAELAAVAGGVLVNVGTLSAEQEEAMRKSIASCLEHDVPWVLDPVAVSAPLSRRRSFVGEILKSRPFLVRGNAREIAYLRSLKGNFDLPTLATGAIDEYVGPGGGFRLLNGTERLSRVTATGCAHGAIAAAFAAVAHGDVRATAAAAALAMALSGEFAAERTTGIGSFQIAILDAIESLAPADFTRLARFK